MYAKLLIILGFVMIISAFIWLTYPNPPILSIYPANADSVIIHIYRSDSVITIIHYKDD